MAIAVALLISLLASSSSSEAVYARTSADDAANAAIELSRLESLGQASALYTRMHPDAQAIIPEPVVVGWYENDFFPLSPQPISEIISVTFLDWTWGVTNQIYRHTAEITFIQPFGTGANITYQQETVRLVEVDEEWRWFFGRTPEFVDEQIARFPGTTASSSHATLDSSLGGASSPYSFVVTCEQVVQQIGITVYAYCEWPFFLRTPLRCVPAFGAASSGSVTFACKPAGSAPELGRGEISLEYAAKLIYTVEVYCEVEGKQWGTTYGECNWPMFGAYSRDCIVDESRTAFPYEKYLLCKP